MDTKNSEIKSTETESTETESTEIAEGTETESTEIAEGTETESTEIAEGTETKSTETVSVNNVIDNTVNNKSASQNYYSNVNVSSNATPSSESNSIDTENALEKKIKEEDEILRKKILLAEKPLYQGLELKDAEEAEKFLTKIVNSKWFKSRVRSITNISVKEIDGTKAVIKQRNLSVYMFVPKISFKEMLLLGFLATVTVGSKDHRFGKKYASMKLKLVKRFMGKEFYNDLKMAYKENNIKFIVRKDAE